MEVWRKYLQIKQLSLEQLKCSLISTICKVSQYFFLRLKENIVTSPIINLQLPRFLIFVNVTLFRPGSHFMKTQPQLINMQIICTWRLFFIFFSMSICSLHLNDNLNAKNQKCMKFTMLHKCTPCSCYWSANFHLSPSKFSNMPSLTMDDIQLQIQVLPPGRDLHSAHSSGLTWHLILSND